MDVGGLLSTETLCSAFIQPGRHLLLEDLIEDMGLLNILSSIRDRAEKFLNEKNVVTDVLGKLEEKTGVKKKIIALGT